MSYWGTIPAGAGVYELPQLPAQAVANLGWRGLQALAPNLASLLVGEAPPSLPNVPTTPGKVPSTDDPRPSLAAGEIANVAINFVPLPGAGAAGAGRGVLGLLRRGAPESVASRSARLYNPPVKAPRPFEADYPAGAPTDATGRLAADIEGRPLTARYVVGRKVVGGDDSPLPLEEYDALTKAGTGKLPQTIAPSKIGGAAGAVAVDRIGRPTDLYLSGKLAAQQVPLVHAHEIAHVVDQLAGNIATKGLSRELKDVYNTLNNPNRSAGGTEAASWGRPFTPQTLGYKGEEIPREYVVEAIRAYMADPNFLKTVAPKTAAAIRAVVNPHPTVSQIIQFNTIAALAAGIDPEALPMPKQSAPVFSR